MKGFRVEIVEYNRKPCGVVVALHDQGEDHGLGFSLCNPMDKFDVGMGVRIALGRAEKLNHGRRMSVWDKLDHYVGKAQKRGDRVLAEKLTHQLFPSLHHLSLGGV